MTQMRVCVFAPEPEAEPASVDGHASRAANQRRPGGSALAAASDAASARTACLASAAASSRALRASSHACSRVTCDESDKS